MNKWIGISLGGILGLSHIGMIGMIANRPSKMPTLNLPVGEYTSYKAKVSMDGYEIDYKANDPKTVLIDREVKEKGGFLGLGNNTERLLKEVPVTPIPYRNVPEEYTDQTTATRSEACIESIGAGKGTGRMVGASVGAAVAPSLTPIPFVGWVLAGAATMIGMDQGAEIGGQMTEDLSPKC
tara:strand:+ start:317 stop:859 length:543 start_codon:yes stop_codon:yes gene_type:complete